MDDTYFQLFERLISREERNKHFSSSRYLHREFYGYTRAYFAQRKLIRNESSILEKDFWEMIFATRDIKEVDVSLIICFMMVTNLNYYFDNYEELRKDFRVIVEDQFEHNLYYKLFSNQLESEDGTDTFERRIEWWMLIINKIGPIPHNVYEYSFGELS